MITIISYNKTTTQTSIQRNTSADPPQSHLRNHQPTDTPKPSVLDNTPTSERVRINQNLENRNQRNWNPLIHRLLLQLLVTRSETRNRATHQPRPIFLGRGVLPTVVEALPRQVDQRDEREGDEEDGDVRSDGAELSPVEPEPPPSAPRHILRAPAHRSPVPQARSSSLFPISIDGGIPCSSMCFACSVTNSGPTGLFLRSLFTSLSLFLVRIS